MAWILHQLKLVQYFIPFLQNFIHPRWCRISSINSITWKRNAWHNSMQLPSCGRKKNITKFVRCIIYHHVNSLYLSTPSLESTLLLPLLWKPRFLANLQCHKLENLNTNLTWFMCILGLDVGWTVGLVSWTKIFMLMVVQAMKMIQIISSWSLSWSRHWFDMTIFLHIPLHLRVLP